VKFRALTAVAFSAVLLSGCSTDGKLSGSAAVVNGQAIPQTEVTKQVNEARMQIEQTNPADIPKVPTLIEISQRVVDRLILKQVLAEAVKRENIDISKSDVATFRDGVFAQYGQDKIEAQLVSQNGVAASHVDEFMYQIMAQRAIMQKLAPGSDQTTQSKTLYRFLSSISNDLGTRLNPRYGEWDPNNMTSVPGDLELSVPAAQ
jgi:outer membrane murein-binding lipoprotein Lpp